MSEFDDPILRDRLSRYAGTAPGDDAAYAGVQRRVRHVKRRRVAVWSGAAAVVIGVGAAGALSGPDGTRVTVTPADETELSTSSSASSTSSSSSTSTSIEATTTIASTAPVTEVTTGSSVEEDSGSGSGSESTSGSGGRGPSGGTNPTSPTAPAQPIAPAPQDGSRAAVGGVLHVRLANGSLTIVSSVPNPGFGMDIKDSGGGRVRVEFESSDHKSRVTATIVNGTIVFSVEEEDEGRTGATSSTVGGDDGPTTTDDHGDGGGGGGGGDSGGGGGGGDSSDD